MYDQSELDVGQSVVKEVWWTCGQKHTQIANGQRCSDELSERMS